MSINIQEYITNLEGVDEKGVSNSRVDLVSTMVNIKDEKLNQESVVNCTGASVDFRDLGGYIMLDLEFPTADNIQLKMVYNYLEKYGNDLDGITEESKVFPEISLFIENRDSAEYYIILANPIFWARNIGKNKAEYTAIRILFEEKNYGFFQNK